MKKRLFLVLGITLLLCFGSVLYLIGNGYGYFIDYNDINNFEEMFENQEKDIRIDTADGITYTTKVIVDNYRYRIVGTKSYKEISIAILNKQTQKLDIYSKKLLLKNNNTFLKVNTVDFSNNE